MNPKVRYAFFARFGGRLRPIQQTAFAEMEKAKDRDVLVIAQTGSGKTEAVLAPVADHLFNDRSANYSGIRALVISPTRALASDLYRRMAPVFQELNLRMDVMTSDLQTVSKSESTDILIRTPEGLDRDLCYRRDILSNIKEVVIDEIHQFINSSRGTQLAGLLSRLLVLSPQHRRLGISATITSVDAPVHINLLRNPLVIEESHELGTVKLLYYKWIGTPESGANQFITWLRNKGVRKAIGFVKERKRAEEISHLLNRGFLLGKTYCHHADLSSFERRRAEQLFREAQAALIVATTTLEVGIDIGSIDTCILFDAPPNYSSYLQRIGRAGRRSGERRVACVVGLFDRKMDFVRSIDPSFNRESTLDYRPYLSGCIQQILSTIAGYKALSYSDLEKICLTAFGIESSVLKSLLKCLINDGWIAEESDFLVPGLLLYELQRSNHLHLIFSGSSGKKIKDLATGKLIGYIDPQYSKNIIIAGRPRRIVKNSLDVYAIIDTNCNNAKANFMRRGLSIFEQLAIKYKNYVSTNHFNII